MITADEFLAKHNIRMPVSDDGPGDQRESILVCVNANCSQYGVEIEDDVLEYGIDPQCRGCQEVMFTLAEIDEMDNAESRAKKGLEVDFNTMRRIENNLNLSYSDAVIDNRTPENGDLFDQMVNQALARKSNNNSGQDFSGYVGQPMKAQQPVVHTAPDPTLFTCPSDLTSCPVAVKPYIRIPEAMWDEFLMYAREITDLEWMVYLQGHNIDGQPDKWEVTGFTIPDQTVTKSHVEAEDNQIPNGTIAALHSHNTMGVFFSAEDMKHANHNIEIVINSAGEFKANGRTQLGCGRYHRGEATLEVMTDEIKSTRLNNLQAKMKEQKVSYAQPNRSQNTSAASAGLSSGMGYSSGVAHNKQWSATDKVNSRTVTADTKQSRKNGHNNRNKDFQFGSGKNGNSNTVFSVE